MAESRRLLLTLSNAARVQLKLIAVDFPVCVYRYLETLLLLPWLWLILKPILVLHISVAAAAAIELVQPPHTLYNQVFDLSYFARLASVLIVIHCWPKNAGFLLGSESRSFVPLC